MTKKIEEAEIVTTIAEYSATEKGLAFLRNKLAGAVYEVTTTAGLELAKKDRREVVTLRTTLESVRKEIKAPALARCQMIDAEAKRITAELLALELPIDAQIKQEEDRKAEIKRQKEEAELQRVTTIKERIAVITGLHLKLVNVPNSLAMRDIIQTVREQVTATEAEFQEWQPMAQMAIDETLRQMEIILAEKEAAEIEEIRKANEYAEQQKELRLRGDIQEIAGWPLAAQGRPLSDISAAYDRACDLVLTEEYFGSLLLEAEAAKEKSLATLEQMIADAKRAIAEQEELRLAKEAFEKEQEAVRIEAKRVADEWQAEQDAKAAAQKIENDRIAAEQKAAQDKIDAERVALDAQRRIEDDKRKAAEAADLEEKRVERERLAAEAQAKIDEQRRIDEERRVELEKKQQAEFVEKMKKPYSALAKIKELCENKELTALAARNQINAVADIALEGKE